MVSASLNLGATLGGFVAGNVLVSGLLHWVSALVEIRKATARIGGNAAYVGHLLIGTVLNSGPWSLLVAASFSFLYRVGALGSVVLLRRAGVAGSIRCADSPAVVQATQAKQKCGLTFH